MAKTRQNLEKVFGHLYTFDPMGDRMACAYCNDVRETLDHIPPLSIVDKIGTDELYKREIDLVMVPCCSSCNNTLGARMLANYEERLLFLYNHTLDKLDGKVLWATDELEELTGDLKQMVKARQLAIKRELIQRLRGMEQRISALE